MKIILYYNYVLFGIYYYENLVIFVFILFYMVDIFMSKEYVFFLLIWDKRKLKEYKDGVDRESLRLFFCFWLFLGFYF